MSLYLNELSCNNCSSEQNVSDVIEKFLSLIDNIKNLDKKKFKHVQTEKKFYELEFSPGYTINNWINSKSVNQTHKSALLSLITFPYINENDDEIITKYLENTYKYKEKEVEGLAAAYLYDNIAISFNTHKEWDNSVISINEENTTKEKKDIDVKHISSDTHLTVHQAWIEEQKEVLIIKSSLTKKEKKIHLADDHHGKKKLLNFSNKLCESPYVIGIINSIPFSPTQQDFVKKIYDDGKIELVLTNTDSGYGVIIQTTGRSRKETMEISRILTQIFCK